MPLATSTAKAEQVPQADATNPEREAFPLDYSLATTEQTIPIATNHLEAVTFFFKVTGAGAAEVWVRGDPADAWILYSTQNPVTIPTKTILCPTGQLKVINNGLTTLQVRVQGLVKNG
jgi:hypothetical protein